jgi:hypothetical protein
MALVGGKTGFGAKRTEPEQRQPSDEIAPLHLSFPAIDRGFPIIREY